MQKHIEDDGDLSILVSDDGEVLLVCAEGHQWVGKFETVSRGSSDVRRALESALRTSNISESVRGFDMKALR